MIEFGVKATSAAATDTLITPKWLAEFNQDIKHLQAMIKHYSELKAKESNISQSDHNGLNKNQQSDYTSLNKQQSDNTVLSKQQKDYSDLDKNSGNYTGVKLCEDKTQNVSSNVFDNYTDQTNINEVGASVCLDDATLRFKSSDNSSQTNISQSVCADITIHRHNSITNNNNNNNNDKASIRQGGSECVCVDSTITNDNSDTSDQTLLLESGMMKRVLSTQTSLYDSGFEDSLTHLHDRTHTSLTYEEEEEKQNVTEFMLSSTSIVHDPCSESLTPNNKMSLTQDTPSIIKTSSSPSKEDDSSLTTPPRSEEYCSIQSIASRDSGFCTTDDVPSDFLGDEETSGHKSLLEELDSVCGDHYNLSSPSSPANRVPVGAVRKDTGVEGDVSPVWYTRFSFGEYQHQQMFPDTLCLSLGRSLGDLSSITVDSSTSGPNTDYFGADINCDEVSRRDRKRRLGIFGGNQEHTFYGTQSRGVLEAREMVHDYYKITERLHALRTDLVSLTQEVRDSREELRNLECRTSQLMTSASTCRVKLGQLYAMRTLEERLQEEWWAAYNPDTLPLNENYIV